MNSARSETVVHICLLSIQQVPRYEADTIKEVLNKWANEWIDLCLVVCAVVLKIQRPNVCDSADKQKGLREDGTKIFYWASTLCQLLLLGFLCRWRCSAKWVSIYSLYYSKWSQNRKPKPVRKFLSLVLWAEAKFVSAIEPLYSGRCDFSEPFWSYTYVKYVLLIH